MASVAQIRLRALLRLSLTSGLSSDLGPGRNDSPRLGFSLQNSHSRSEGSTVWRSHMGAIIIPFETRAQREERLYYELMTAYRTYIRVEHP